MADDRIHLDSYSAKNLQWVVVKDFRLDFLMYRWKHLISVKYIHLHSCADSVV